MEPPIWSLVNCNVDVSTALGPLVIDEEVDMPVSTGTFTALANLLRTSRR